MEKLIMVARGKRKADLVLKNAAKINAKMAENNKETANPDRIFSIE